MKKCTNSPRKEALAAIKRMRELAHRIPSRFTRMTKEQIILKLRESREKLWEEHIAHHS
ncbi:MAG: hypothetical protein HQL20_01270 [Candidatus Omnitrophica bacterium]|nr:hypothetical protein [Candidatus Omnitrophota bacterium]